MAPLRYGGIAADPRAPDGIASLPAGPHAVAQPPDAAQRRWLASGLVPGATGAQRATAARALLDVRLLTRPDGAVAAAWRPGWEYAWPRDSSWVAAALAVTGHGGKALDILRFLARVQPRAGSGPRAYQLSGDAPVRDGRPAELDSGRLVPVGGVDLVRHPAQRPRTRRAIGGLWPAVHNAADTTAALLGRGGLPPASLDYWEDRVSSVTLGIAAPLLTGLRAAADLARALDRAEDAARWSAAARRLDHAIRVSFGATGYQRTPDPASGADAAITFLGPPFAPATAPVRRAVAATARRLTLPNGGIAPGSAWGGAAGQAWTAETAFFALYDAALRGPRGRRPLAGLAGRAPHRVRLAARAGQRPRAARLGRPAGLDGRDRAAGACRPAAPAADALTATSPRSAPLVMAPVGALAGLPVAAHVPPEPGHREDPRQARHQPEHQDDLEERERTASRAPGITSAAISANSASGNSRGPRRQAEPGRQPARGAAAGPACAGTGAGIGQVGHDARAGPRRSSR